MTRRIRIALVPVAVLVGTLSLGATSGAATYNGRGLDIASVDGEIVLAGGVAWPCKGLSCGTATALERRSGSVVRNRPLSGSPSRDGGTNRR